MTKEEKDKLFEEQFIPLKPLLIKIASRLTYNYEDTKDLVQEVYFKAYKALDRYSPDYKPIIWLNRILKNTFIDSKRKVSSKVIKVDLSVITDNGLEDLIKVEPGHSFSLNLSDNLSIEFNKLNKDVQLMLYLTVIEDYSYKECSVIFNIPENTVKTTLYRAKQQMKKKLQKNGK